VVPALFCYEIRNVLVVNERRARIEQTGSARFLMRLRDLRLVRGEDHEEASVMSFARAHGLSAYDAAYPETALRRSDTLATLDKSLAVAASAEGVSVIH